MNELSDNLLLINSVVFFLLNVIFAIIFLHLFFNYKLKPTYKKFTKIKAVIKNCQNKNKEIQIQMKF